MCVWVGGRGVVSGEGGQVIGEITLQWRYVLSLYPPLSVIVISPLHLSPPSTFLCFSVASVALLFQLPFCHLTSVIVFRNLATGKHNYRG